MASDRQLDDIDVLTLTFALELQKPSFVNSTQDISSVLSFIEDLSILRKRLHTKKNIIIISGAGISTNSGIPDYRSSSRTKHSSHIVYDASAYSTVESADRLHADILHKLRLGQAGRFTTFDTFAERLAQSNRLQNHYTQNIDCHQTRLRHLSQKTIWLHGRADTLVCHLHPSHTILLKDLKDLQAFSQLVTATCTKCEEVQRERAIEHKRRHAMGFLRPNVLLYGEHCTDEVGITSAFNRDLAQPVDAVLIVGTRLSIPSLAGFAERLCKVVRANSPDNLVIWVSKEPPKLGKAFQSLISFEYRGDCDNFAWMMSE